MSAIRQAQFCVNQRSSELLQGIEDRYEFFDEREKFSKLVNFSTAKKEPYQRWVRYREGYATALVEELMQRACLDPNTEFVLDPMVGSGSTLVTAANSGISALGIDANPYCKLIADAKLLRPSKSDLDSVVYFVSRLAPKGLTPAELPMLSDYFPRENLTGVLDIRCQIDALSESNAKTILLAAWFFFLESCSNRKKDGNGLATRPSPVSDVYEHFTATVNEMVRDYGDSPLSCEGVQRAICGSAMDLSSYASIFSKELKKELSAVIFSPPYANSFDYFESYKLELLFGGFYTWDEFKAHKNDLVRNYRITGKTFEKSAFPIVEALCEAIEQEIPKKEEQTGKRDGRTRLMPNMLRGYFADMAKVISEAFSALSKGGRCYIVVDQSAYVGVIIPTDTILAYIGELVGFKVKSISVCRRAATSGQQLKKYPYLKDSLRESIVELEKPI